MNGWLSCVAGLGNDLRFDLCFSGSLVFGESGFRDAVCLVDGRIDYPDYLRDKMISQMMGTKMSGC